MKRRPDYLSRRAQAGYWLRRLLTLALFWKPAYAFETPNRQQQRMTRNRLRACRWSLPFRPTRRGVRLT